jgi:hypothetical protein
MFEVPFDLGGAFQRLDQLAVRPALARSLRGLRKQCARFFWVAEARVPAAQNQLVNRVDAGPIGTCAKEQLIDAAIAGEPVLADAGAGGEKRLHDLAMRRHRMVDHGPQGLP